MEPTEPGSHKGDGADQLDRRKSLRSSWLKAAVQGAVQNDPITVLNELEVLKDALVRWADANIEMMLVGNGYESPGKPRPTSSTATGDERDDP